MPQIVYLDENGNPQKDAPIYLDANGNPGPAGHSSDYMARQNALIDKMQADAQGGGVLHGIGQSVSGMVKGIAGQFSPSNLSQAFRDPSELAAEDRLQMFQQQQAQKKAGYSST